MNKTLIEWVKNPDGSQGYTWNPITGCLNHVDGMCKGGDFPCYAYRLANGRLKQRYTDNGNYAPRGYGYPMTEDILVLNDPFYPRFWQERLCEPLQGNRYSEKTDLVLGKPKGIFVCDMSDLFGIGIPEQWTKRVLDTIRMCPQHRFYLLTKQPQNLPQWSPFPDNCWVGVTITSDSFFDNGLCGLLNIIAKKRYISFEPLLGRVEVTPQLFVGIDWVIIGAQTKPYKPPKIEWVQEIALACTKAHIPLFLKDNLRPILPNRMPFWSPVSWTEIDKGVAIRMTENRLRQELPV